MAKRKQATGQNGDATRRETFGASPSANETTGGDASATSGQGAAGRSSTVTGPSMTQGEALAVAWTGIEELIRQKRAALMRHPDGTLYVRLDSADYDKARGLVVK